MRWFSFLAILMLVTRSFAPCCFADWVDSSHAPMFLGVVSHVLLGHADTPSTPCHPTPAPQSGWDNGALIFIPSGDWQNFLIDFFLAAFAWLVTLPFLPILLARLATRHEFPDRVHLGLLDPPPRAAFV